MVAENPGRQHCRSLSYGHTRGILGWDRIEVDRVAFSPDGRVVAAGCRDHTARLWEVDTRRERAPLSGFRGWVNEVAFVSDGVTIAAASYDPTVKFWDAQTGRLTRTLTGHAGRIESLAFSPDGKTLATGGGGGDTAVKLWDLSAK